MLVSSRVSALETSRLPAPVAADALAPRVCERFHTTLHSSHEVLKGDARRHFISSFCEASATHVFNGFEGFAIVPEGSVKIIMGSLA